MLDIRFGSRGIRKYYSLRIKERDEVSNSTVTGYWVAMVKVIQSTQTFNKLLSPKLLMILGNLS